MKNFLALLVFTGLAGAIGCGHISNASAPSSVQLTGAGSTFVYPLMARWGADFHAANPDITINYQSIGSGGGIQQVKNGTVDFGASDAALSDAQLAAMPALVQIPESAGPVCITYNLPLQQPLRLSAAALSGIFLGAITQWNDPAIAQSNPGVTLPHQAILVAHRSEGSGTTSIFTTYLSAVSADWLHRAGSGVSVSWPVGLGGKGSEGVTGIVKQTTGAIGYVELTYAEANQLPVALIQNAAGHFIAPSAESSSAAIAVDADLLARDTRLPIVNPPGPDAYPIAGLTFLLLPKTNQDPAKQAALAKFVAYLLGPGQNAAAALHYAPLPDSLQQLDRTQLANLR